jgi:hypothetical protein
MFLIPPLFLSTSLDYLRYGAADALLEKHISSLAHDGLFQSRLDMQPLQLEL